MRREFLLIVNVALISIFVGVSLYYFAPSPQSTYTVSDAAPATVNNAPAQASQAILFNVLDTGTHAASVAVRKNYAVYAKEDFVKLWKMAHGTDGSPLPKVDFSKEYVIGIFAGEKSTGGNSIAVASVIDAGAVRTVAVTLTKSGADCMVTQSLMNPYQIVAVPLSDASLTHSDTEVATPCK